MCRSAYGAPWKAGGNKRGLPTLRQVPVQKPRKGTAVFSEATAARTWLCPLFDPARLRQAGMRLYAMRLASQCTPAETAYVCEVIHGASRACGSPHPSPWRVGGWPTPHGKGENAS